MVFLRRAPGRPGKVGVFPGAFNPPTRAHLALAGAALSHVDELVFVLPRVFPHKHWEGATLEQRVRMLEQSAPAAAPFSIAVSEQGLFAEIARECRAVYADAELWFVCGEDAAERIVTWDYAGAERIEDQLRDYGLLVAPRLSDWLPPAALRARIVPLQPSEACAHVSATDVRTRVANGLPWEHLVPPGIVDLVRAIYRRPK